MTTMVIQIYFLKIANPNSVDKLMQMNTRIPLWYGDDDDILFKVKQQNANHVLPLERGHMYESRLNFIRYSFQPKDKNEPLEGYTAKILKLKEM